MSNKLSPKQFSAYLKMDYDKWKSAYELGFPIRTLDALVNKGYAKKKIVIGHLFFPKNCTLYCKTEKAL